jgi:VIT1/CCC1 family predicted Fe2+/Mn2+ transporter
MTGTFLPAVPFLFMTGWPAFAAMIVICLVTGALVGAMRARQNPGLSTAKAVVMTVAGLVLIFGIILALSHVIPGGGA